MWHRLASTAAFAGIAVALSASCAAAPPYAPQPASQTPVAEAPAPSQAASDTAAASAADDLAAMSARADAFLDLLDGEQRRATALPFADPGRANWSNLPASAARAPRSGARMGDLNPDQTAALHEFMATALSPEGYRTVWDIVGAEAVLAGSARADSLGWHEDNYWFAVFGTPSATEPWAWQFGGHHLAVNMTLRDGRVFMSPTFLGTNPAVYETESGTVVPLGQHEAAALTLIATLDAAIRMESRLTRAPGGVITGAGRDGHIPPLEGVSASPWTQGQRSALLSLAAQWVNLMPAHSAAARLSEIESRLDETHFAWHGPQDGNAVAYYRLQGPELIIEYSVEGALGIQAGHLHSIYRNPANEYGQGN